MLSCTAVRERQGRLADVAADSHWPNADFWDTAGQERFENLHPSYFYRANSAIVGFDVTRKASGGAPSPANVAATASPLNTSPLYMDTAPSPFSLAHV